MLHNLPQDEIGPLAAPMADAISSCVHCGFCLPDCPTYRELGEEMDSPRGRIFLMKSALEGEVSLDEMLPYVDRCLGCLGCETSCPSGVQYGELLTPFRALANKKRQRTIASRLKRLMVLSTLPYPWRFRLAVRMGRLAQPVRGLLPSSLGTMLDLLPERLPKSQPLPPVYPAVGVRRARVALLSGCAQQVLAPQINWATLRVLARNGVEVVVPANQQCCGALAAHTGAMPAAKASARHNMSCFPTDIDAIITNAAGCGSGMREYGLWMTGEEDQQAAKRMATRVQDVSEFLSKLGITPPPPLPTALRVAYHDACHLAHAQNITAQPRDLLSAIPNVDLIEIPNGNICCGSAGTYNVEQPDIAQQLGQQKAASIVSSNADVVVAGNIGCMIQIDTHLKQQGQSLPVLHTIELLDQAYATSEKST